jgi:murein DD-endopeptidase MepM/ murein hydrolase activator NlpD
MLKNYYTIFVTPPKTGRTKQFHFRKKTFYVLILLLTLFIIGDYIAIVTYRESANLKKKNAQQKGKIEELEKVTKVVDEIKKDESFIRDFLGLEKSGSSMGGPGTGGTGGTDPELIDSSYTISLDLDTTVSHKKSEDNRSLLTTAFLLKKDLEELRDELLDRKSEWDTRPTIMPLQTDEYWISSGFGWRKGPFTGLREFHRGLDISAKRGTPILAPADGVVISAGKDRHIGRFIKIRHTEKITTLFGHMLELKAKKGDNVTRGTIIGLMGNSGRSTGYHLHYEVRKDDVSDNPHNHILNSHISNTLVAMR